VFGVEVVIDWSWVFTFVLAAWTLVTIAERALPSSPPGVLTLLSAAAAIGLFASLAVHEVAHGLAARACGVPVKRVTLFQFGSVTDVERDPASPKTEAVAALVAPIANAVIGVALLGLAAAVGAARARAGGDVPAAPGALLVRWLGAANLAIAAIHLLPAFPLDGGRLVRAAIWRATGDVERATRWAAWSGQVIGWTLVALGIGLAFASHGVGVAMAMWIAFVGWFLTSAAAQAYAAVRSQTALAKVTMPRLVEIKELEK
jgi:Zn-dependent protease